MVYFARLASGLIKIGTTIDFHERMRAHNADGPIDVLGVHDGGRREEVAIHRRFAHLRAPKRGRGAGSEHFRTAPELLGYIAENCREPGPSDRARRPRVSDGMECVKVPGDVIESARIVAAYRGVSMGELMGDILRPTLARMEREEAERRASGQAKRKGASK